MGVEKLGYTCSHNLTVGLGASSDSNNNQLPFSWSQCTKGISLITRSVSRTLTNHVKYYLICWSQFNLKGDVRRVLSLGKYYKVAEQSLRERVEEQK